MPLPSCSTSPLTWLRRKISRTNIPNACSKWSNGWLKSSKGSPPVKLRLKRS